MKKSRKLSAAIAILLSVFIFNGCNLYSYVPSGVQTSYENPQWAPPYYEGARYYYLPDIESYYDLSMNEFITLNNGRWYYSSSIPSMYSGYDLNDCFLVVLNNNVYEPWMHHQYYVSHYPRYYYRDYYDRSNYPYVRGFNENLRSAFYWGENESGRARSWDDSNLRDNRQFKYTNEDRQTQREIYNQVDRRPEPNNSNYDRNTQTQRVDDRATRTNNTENRSTDANRSTRTDNTENRSTDANRSTRTNNTETRTTVDDRATRSNNTETRTTVDTRATRSNNTETRTPVNDNATRQQATRTSEAGRTQNTNYYGRTIGNPVKVEKQMQEKSAEKPVARTPTKTETNAETKANTRR